MSLYSTPTRWGSLARLFHWGMALAIAGMVGVGLWMTTLPLGMRKLNVYALHKSIGITLLGVAVLRLGWRLLDRRPAAPAGQPAWQTGAAHAVHGLIYLLLLGIPLSGWLYNSASGFPLRWFKLANLPKLADADPGLKAIAHALHEYGAWALVALVLGHAAAALWHHVVLRDHTLSSMIPPLEHRAASGAPPEQTS